EEWTVGADAEETLTLEFTAPHSVSAGQLFSANSAWSLSLPHGGPVAVSELWLEVEEVVAPASVSLDVTAAGFDPSEGVRLDYNRVEVDVRELMGAEATWEFFGNVGGELRVTFELLNPPDRDPWNLYIRDAHWRQAAYPATRVSPTDVLFATVDGRAVRGDGTANAAECVRELLTDEDLAAVPETELDGSSFDAAAEEADARGIAFAAVFMEDLRVGEALECALGEGIG